MIEIVLPAISEDALSRGLYRLSEWVGRLDPINQTHGILGGEWGYGQTFSNDVFEMRPYWWGDCDCGFDERETEWEKDHPHAPECSYAAWVARDCKDPFGRCTCSGRGVEYRKWAKANGHRDTCSLELPNFRHKASGIAVCWYKYIGRDMKVNRTVSARKIGKILDECYASLPVVALEDS